MAFSEQQIAENYQRVCEEIREAAQTFGRSPEDVQLVVVTKAQPAEVLRAVVKAGARVVGENYPEETIAKMDRLLDLDDIQWQMIGHLQSRKARLVTERFHRLHSLDSLSLAEKLERLLAVSDRRLPVLFEFNVGGEESKFGWDASQPERWAEHLTEVKQIAALPHLDVQGLMTMPPFSDKPEDSRPYFQRLRHFRDFLQAELPDLHLQHLSMGTSGDYRIAIEEGSTFVRVGQAIVGSRPPKTLS